MAKHYNTQNDSASLSAFFFYVHNVSFVSWDRQANVRVST